MSREENAYVLCSENTSLPAYSSLRLLETKIMKVDILSFSGPMCTKKPTLHGELALDRIKGVSYNCTTFTMQ